MVLDLVGLMAVADPAIGVEGWGAPHAPLPTIWRPLGGKIKLYKKQCHWDPVNILL